MSTYKGFCSHFSPRLFPLVSFWLLAAPVSAHGGLLSGCLFLYGIHHSLPCFLVCLHLQNYGPSERPRLLSVLPALSQWPAHRLINICGMKVQKRPLFFLSPHENAFAQSRMNRDAGGCEQLRSPRLLWDVLIARTFTLQEGVALEWKQRTPSGESFKTQLFT